MNRISRYDPSEESLMVVFNLMYKENAVIQYSDLSPDAELQLIFQSPSRLNQEDIFIKKESYLKLTSESREVIDTILNAPNEMLEMITTSKFGLYSKRALKKYLMKNGWKERKVNKVFGELAVFVNGFGG